MIVKSPEGIRLDGRMPLNMVEVGNPPNRGMVQMQRDSRDLLIVTCPSIPVTGCGKEFLLAYSNTLTNLPRVCQYRHFSIGSNIYLKVITWIVKVLNHLMLIIYTALISFFSSCVQKTINIKKHPASGSVYGCGETFVDQCEKDRFTELRKGHLLVYCSKSHRAMNGSYFVPS